jgi:hypothetical protein
MDCSGQVSVAVCGHTSVHVAGVTGNPRIQWDVIEDEEIYAVPRSTPKAIGTPSIRREDRENTDKVKNFLLAGPIGPGGGRELPAARQWSCPTSPPRGVLRLMPSTSTRGMRA